MTHETISHPDYTYCDMLISEIIEVMYGYIHGDKKKLEDTLMETYIFAREAHEGQYRKSGEPYITHPLEAAKILLTLKPDIISVQSCILHDVIEDTEYEKADIEKRFGHEVAIICE
jgi:GTP diphosphokinase / guanosine-3',5'-bis(diphosphate) 3'-diphosphatase